MLSGGKEVKSYKSLQNYLTEVNLLLEQIIFMSPVAYHSMQ